VDDHSPVTVQRIIISAAAMPGDESGLPDLTEDGTLMISGLDAEP
jgi:hypothetical protein